MEQVVKSICKHEGFEPIPYPDYLHGWDKPTFGHGLTYITEEESLEIVRRRAIRLDLELHQKVQGYRKMPSEVKQVLIEMAYQMGVGGLLKFTDTLSLLQEGKYKEASREMLDSLWARQTRRRAEELSQQICGLE